MSQESGRWTEITPSQFPWEQEALASIRERLPDHDPYRAWSSFEFITPDGSKRRAMRHDHARPIFHRPAQ
jgi:hypothetical protein